jgi:hypothetical protein
VASAAATAELLFDTALLTSGFNIDQVSACVGSSPVHCQTVTQCRGQGTKVEASRSRGLVLGGRIYSRALLVWLGSTIDNMRV